MFIATSPTTWWSVYTKTQSYKNPLCVALLVAPAALVYHAGIPWLNGIGDSVDMVTPSLFALFNGNELYYLLLVAALAGMSAVLMARSCRGFTLRLFVFTLAEALCFGAILIIVARLVEMQLATQHLFNGMISAKFAHGLHDTSAFQNIILSCGAGFYEELVFRLLFVAGSAWLLRALLIATSLCTATEPIEKERGWYGIYATGSRALRALPETLILCSVILVSSAVFSGMHYLGPFGEAWQIYSFMYRGMLGVVFATIFLTRGFAVAVYTHIFYDVIVLLH